MMTRTQYLLGKLAEEATEVAQRALKAQQFGLCEIQAGKAETNQDRLIGEVIDMLSVLKRLQMEAGVPFFSDWDPRYAAKDLKMAQYYEYARSLGQVQ